MRVHFALFALAVAAVHLLTFIDGMVLQMLLTWCMQHSVALYEIAMGIGDIANEG